MAPSKSQLLAHAGALLKVPLNCSEASVGQLVGIGPGSRRPIDPTLCKESSGGDQHWVRHGCEPFQKLQVEEAKQIGVRAPTALRVRSWSEWNDVSAKNIAVETLYLTASVHGHLGQD